MTDSNDTAVQVALAYHQAWTGHDFEQAMTYIDPAIVCDAPAGRLEGGAPSRGFWAPCATIVPAAPRGAACGHATTAVVMYDTRTKAVPAAPGAEYVTVADGRITYMRIVFDRVPFEAARQAVTPR